MASQEESIYVKMELDLSEDPLGHLQSEVILDNHHQSGNEDDLLEDKVDDQLEGFDKHHQSKDVFVNQLAQAVNRQPEDSLNHHLQQDDPPKYESENEPGNQPVHHRDPQSTDCTVHRSHKLKDASNRLKRASPGTAIYKRVRNNRLLEKIKDVQQKIIVANEILNVCREELNYDQTELSTLTKLQHYTKKTSDYLDSVTANDYKLDRSLQQAIIDTKNIPDSVLSYIYSDIRDIFIEYYLEYKQVPTITDFLKKLQSKRDNAFYQNLKFRTLVKNNLVKYHHISKLNRYILTENPEFAYQRNLYLRQIVRHRSDGENFIYVAVRNTHFDGRSMSLAIAASITAGIIDKSYSNIFDDDYKVGNRLIKNWIQFELIPKLAPNSIIVLSQPQKQDTLPTMNSTKEKMINWLEQRNIPCDTDTHRAQLYNLIKISKKGHKETGLYDEVFASSGFHVIICPDRYERLDFFKTVSLSHPGYEEMLTKPTQEEWWKIEGTIIEEEKKTMRDDMDMGKIVDNLLQIGKTEAVKEDFPKDCCGTTADNFAMHIGDIIVDWI